MLLANPHAGRGNAARISAELQTALGAAGARVQRELTTSIEHATALASSAAESGRVSVAIGGDGLLRAVAAGAAASGGTIGVVPCGRGNDYARMIGITGVTDCVRVLLDAAPRPADCIAVAPGFVTVESGAASVSARIPFRVAIGNVYVGFDSLSNALANRITVNLGRFSYSYTAFRVALTMRPFHYRLVVDDIPIEYAGSGVVIANSGYYGRGVPVAPTADVHDGQLDVVMFQQRTRRARVAALLALRGGSHLHRADVQHLRASRIQVQLDPSSEAFSDGDPIGPTPLTAWVLPAAVQLLRP